MRRAAIEGEDVLATKSSGSGKHGRRAALLTAITAGASAFACTRNPYVQSERRVDGRIGVCLLDSRRRGDDGHRLEERFSMASTFKWALAAAVLAQVDRGRLSLDQRVPVSEAALLEHAPVVRARLAERALSIDALCEAAVTVSDNAAANLLLALIDGPAGWTRFARAAGDDVSRLDRVELELNSNLPGDPRDTTTPRAMAGLLASVLDTERALSSASRAKLRQWMLGTRTGLRRLRARMPASWTIGDKTGTGQRGAVNDVLFAERPGRAGIIVVACFMSDSRASLAQLEAEHADVGGYLAHRLERGGR